MVKCKLTHLHSFKLKEFCLELQFKTDATAKLLSKNLGGPASHKQNF